MDLPFNKIAIIGTGMIGASFGLAVRKRKLAGQVVGCGRTPGNLENALKIGAVDETTTDAAAAVVDADMVLYAAHNAAFEPTLKAIAGHLKPGAVVTDVGSIKTPIIEIGERLVPEGCYFVGGHPIAGKEKSGAINAVDGLFDGARCILTPTDKTDPGALAAVRKLWEGIGSIMIELDPVLHDHVLAAISHLPHIVAYALVNAVGQIGEKEPEVMLFPAGGFGDITRVASSNPEMWRDVSLMNRKALLEAIDVFIDRLQLMADQIKNSEAEALFEQLARAKKTRETILVHGRPGG